MKKLCSVAILIMVFFGATPTHAVEVDSGVTFGPYIQRIKKTAVSILLHTDSVQAVTVNYRAQGSDNWLTMTDSPKNQHAFRVTGLTEGGVYEYYFESSTGMPMTLTYTFATKRRVTKKHPLRVAVFGDSGGFTTDQLRVAQQMQWWNPDILLHTGDIAYDAGTENQFITSFFKAYQPLIAQVPFYGSIGNHDYVTDQAGPYKEFFECPVKFSSTEDYYAFNYGPVHFVSLNTNLDYSEGSEMYQWLVSDLQNTKKKWKVVFFHHPMYSSGEHGSTANMADILGPVFENNGVQLVLNGHDHDYERNVPVNNVLYIVTGGGGHSLYDQVTENTQSSLFVSEYHFLALRITDNKLIAEAIDKRGYPFDEFTITR